MAAAPGTPIPGMDYFTTKLPIELLRTISKDLDLFSRLELRRVFPKCRSDIVTDLLGEAVETLYIAPNETSIRHFQAICESEYFRNLITKVVFVPQYLGFSTPAHGTFESLKQYRKMNPGLNALEAEVSFSLYRRVIEELHYRLTDLVEPQDKDPLRWELIENSLSAALEQGMKRLPAVKEIGVAGAIDHEGLNISSAFLSWPLKETLSARRPHASLEATTAVERWTRKYMSTDHVNAFLDAVHQAVPRLESFFLGQSLQSAVEFRIQRDEPIYSKSLRLLLRNVVKFEVSVEDCDDLPYGKDCPLWVYIARGMPKLQMLKIWLSWRTFRTWPMEMPGRRVIDYLLDSYARIPSRCYSELKTFEVFGCPTAMTLIDATLMHKFLADHSTTLEEVRLRNVCMVDNLLVDGDGVPNVNGDDVDSKIRQFLQRIQPLVSKMKRFQMLTSRDGEEWYNYAKEEALT